jgi:hypothetical protein
MTLNFYLLKKSKLKKIKKSINKKIINRNSNLKTIIFFWKTTFQEKN